MSLLELFCDVDDFWKAFELAWKKYLLGSRSRQRWREMELSASEIMLLQHQPRLP